ncbi:hypothetical protein K458DRAFT_390259 [Lentithecium fluviatile CBS 122367]|uniref:Uncharacterized protein n=1 Tax=Lentithecium fluviatile CBS 122367 TaxID=1168545 RepID=A0A6G1IYE1_9PLEO|nr:hypothetical protein K458DRAFT_390259 [Lentithecium fluviatile CBS 122367]
MASTAPYAILFVLLENFVESADQTLSVLKHYSIITDYYIRSVLNPEAASQHVANAKQEWEGCPPRKLDLSFVDRSRARYPAFDNMGIDYHGSRCSTFETYIYDVLFNSGKQHFLIKNTLLNQPHYEAQPEDSDD